jgi:hypothetical protein
MKKNILFITLCLLIFFCCGRALASTEPDAKFITRFSFRQFNGGVIVVKALLNNLSDSLNFIFDTGSGGISLDSATCARLGIKAIPSDTTITGMGEAHKVCFVFDQTLHFPGLTVDKLNFHVSDYSALSSIYGEKIDGIIGYSFFSRYIVKVDFDSLKIEVYNPGKIKYPKEGVLLHPDINNIPMQKLLVKDARKVNFNFYFDTGAGLCFLISEAFAKDSGVLLASRRPLVTEAEGLGGKLQMNLTIIKLLQLGPYKFRSVPTYIFKDEYNVTSYPNTGGLFGNDLLRRFNFVINYPKQEIYLSPNGHFNDPFDYSYTGLSIFYIDGQIIVGDVVANSPAAAAGLEKEDILISVGNDTSNNIQQYKTLLQSPKEKIPLLINRNGKLITLWITPKIIT